MTSIQFAGEPTWRSAGYAFPLRPSVAGAAHLRPHHINSRIPKNTTAYIATGASSHSQSIAGLQ